MGKKIRTSSDFSVRVERNDDIAREIVRLRDKVCQKTGKSSAEVNLQVAHYLSRGNYHTRWDLDNLCLLGEGTHYFWAHKKANEFREFMIGRLGSTRFNALELREKMSAGSPVDTEAWYLYLQAELKKLKAERGIV